MQKADYEYFVGTAWQKDGKSGGLSRGDVKKIVNINLSGRLTLTHGDNIEIIPGIKVFIGSKHTFESQYVLINTTSGKVLVASDNVWFYYNLTNLLSIPMTFDRQAYIENMKRMKGMVTTENFILPGHDFTVMEKFTKIQDGVVKVNK